MNTSWDLVDASKEHDFDIAKLDKNTLPDSLQSKSPQELQSIILSKDKERSDIKKEMAEPLVGVHKENS